jgi:hypothetical protein
MSCLKISCFEQLALPRGHQKHLRDRVLGPHGSLESCECVLLIGVQGLKARQLGLQAAQHSTAQRNMRGAAVPLATTCLEQLSRSQHAFHFCVHAMYTVYVIRYQR